MGSENQSEKKVFVEFSGYVYPGIILEETASGYIVKYQGEGKEAWGVFPKNLVRFDTSCSG